VDAEQEATKTSSFETNLAESSNRGREIDFLATGQVEKKLNLWGKKGRLEIYNLLFAAARVPNTREKEQVKRKNGKRVSFLRQFVHARLGGTRTGGLVWEQNRDQYTTEDGLNWKYKGKNGMAVKGARRAAKGTGRQTDDPQQQKEKIYIQKKMRERCVAAGLIFHGNAP